MLLVEIESKRLKDSILEVEVIALNLISYIVALKLFKVDCKIN